MKVAAPSAGLATVDGVAGIAWRLVMSSGLSTVATSFLSAVLAAQIYISTGSAVLSVLVFAIQWLPPLFFAGLAPKLLTLHTPGTVLRVCEFGNVVMAVLLFWFDWQLAILVILVLRGILETVIRIARASAIKQLIPEARLGRVTANATMAQYAGAVAGAALGIALGFGLWSLYVIVAISVLAVLPLIGLSGHRISHPDSGSRFREVFGRARLSLQRNPELAQTIGLFAVTTMFFQGFITVARTEIAFAYAADPEAWFFWVQQVTSVSIITGALFVSLFWDARTRRVDMGLVAGAGSLVLLVLALADDIISVLAIYAVFVFIFELCFLRLSIEIAYHCKPDEIADVNAMVYAFVTIGMALMTLGAAWTVEERPLADIAVIMAVVCLVLLICLRRVAKQ